MKYLLIVLCMFLLSGCDESKKPVETKQAGDYSVAKLFEHDGCKVYRFYDEGRERYFTNCTETMTEQSYKSGKTTRYYSDNTRNEK